MFYGKQLFTSAKFHIGNRRNYSDSLSKLKKNYLCVFWLDLVQENAMRLVKFEEIKQNL